MQRRGWGGDSCTAERPMPGKWPDCSRIGVASLLSGFEELGSTEQNFEKSVCRSPLPVSVKQVFLYGRPCFLRSRGSVILHASVDACLRSGWFL